MRTVIYLILAAVLIIGGVFFFTSSTNNQTDTPEENQPMDGDQNQTNNLVSYQTTLRNNVRVSLQHPASNTVTQVNDAVIELTYVGPGSEPATEITDGYYASIQLVNETDITAYAQSESDDSIQNIEFSGQSAVSYSTNAALGNEQVTHIVYQPTTLNDSIVDVGYMISASSSNVQNEYQTSLLDTLSSLQFSVDRQVGTSQETIMLAMLDYDGVGQESDGPSRGCDRVVMVERTIPATTTPLNASLTTLFNLENNTVDGWNNFIAQINDTLSFDRATLKNGVASIYLTGELSALGGVCDNPRARIQIEETALQLETVNSVDLYLNGEATDLQPSGA